MQVWQYPCRLYLITPHGDWERSSTVRGSRRFRTHYPSWGLGTIRPRSPIVRRPILITPHGDWELAPDEPLADLEPLITPHGDWEPRCSARLPRQPRPHYPSWGLGTGEGHRHVSLAEPHYPSWGLGTGGRPAADHRPLRLITPHGDWERPKSNRHAHHQAFSLPLMGIGNPTERQPCVGVVVDLITPHGDWEPPGRVGGKGPQRGTSLPLMGIGNLWALCRVRQACRSHYPSWGLGTV